jgi:hypothetical protein
MIVQEEHYCIYLYIPPNDSFRKRIERSRGEIKEISQNPGVSMEWTNYQLSGETIPAVCGVSCPGESDQKNNGG